MGRKKQIIIKEKDIPFLEFKVVTGNFKQVGTYSPNNFFKKYGGF